MLQEDLPGSGCKHQWTVTGPTASDGSHARELVQLACLKEFAFVAETSRLMAAAAQV